MATMETSLAALATSIPGIVEVDDEVITVGDVTHDSRRVDSETMFVAVRGATSDGHTFVRSVIEAGSPAIMVEERIDASIPQIVVSDSRAAMAHLARTVHGFPDTSMTMIGITGTNGKTTVASMLEAVLAADGKSVGLIGTLGARVNGDPIPLERTTPESTDLQRLLGHMRDHGVGSVVMEVSSHALALHRADGIGFDVAGFTNLSQDHLDFHGTMDAYFAEKKKLFDPHRTEIGVVNVSEDAGRTLAEGIEIPVVTVGIEPAGADIVVSIRSDDTKGLALAVDGTNQSFDVRVPLQGAFNAQNAAVAIGIAHRLGVPPESVRAGFASMDGIPGRMQRLSADGRPTVFVDYAHTPDAVSTVVAAARAFARGRLVAVLGAGGDRDREKRESMGAAAGRHADLVVVTNDNPRSEPPEAIAEAVAAGARSAGHSDVVVELDRRAAVALAIEGSGAQDVVLVLGKGHEQGQEVAGRVLPFDDASVVRELLGASGEGSAHART